LPSPALPHRADLRLDERRDAVDCPEKARHVGDGRLDDLKVIERANSLKGIHEEQCFLERWVDSGEITRFFDEVSKGVIAGQATPSHEKGHKVLFDAHRRDALYDRGGEYRWSTYAPLRSPVIRAAFIKKDRPVCTFVCHIMNST